MYQKGMLAVRSPSFRYFIFRFKLGFSTNMLPSEEERSRADCCDDEFNSFQTISPEDLLERGLTENRFRIDRKKLEDMLRGQSNSLACSNEGAEVFFERIMANTSTHISWPSKLKIGAKSKKDPHVKIIGKHDDVQAAKTMILKVLDTKKNRVTLKMDVSHSDHSYIIGKGGFKIQQVMEETGCHIHFPDSNRNSNAEKSNQVSIAGEADGVELARSKIRDLLPLVYMFELPNGVLPKPGDESNPVFQHIQQTYSFNVSFKAVSPGRVMIIVRGCHRLLQRLRQGLSLLMEFLTGNTTVPIGVMKTEIAFQNHSFVMGINGLNIQMIMSKTGAVITFPDPSVSQACPMTIPANMPLPAVATMSQLGLGSAMHALPPVLQTKTSVILQGSFDSVCAAWDELLNSLPLLLMFDLKEGQDVDPILINELMEKNSISIIVRPKIRENIKSVTIRGAEKDARVLFETRKELLGIQDGAGCFSESQTNGHVLGDMNRQNYHIPQQIRNDVSTAESLAIVTKLIQQNPSLLGLLNELSIGGQRQQNLGGDMNGSYNRFAPQKPYLSRKNSYPLSSQDWPRTPGFATDGYLSRNMSSQVPPFFFPPSGDSSPSSPSSPGGDSGFHSKHANSTSSSLYSEPQGSFQHGSHDTYPMSDYQTKKINAAKAMYEDIDTEARMPTTIWSGYGFSKSMPEFMMKDKTSPSNEENQTRRKPPRLDLLLSPSKTNGEFDIEAGLSDQACASNYSMKGLTTSDQASAAAPSPFTLSNFWENIGSAPSSVGCGSIRNLQQLLTFFDLEQYMDIFQKEEIDLTAFLTLTDFDLQQLNINYSGRKKMLNAISAMRDHKKFDSSLGRQFKVAPGAERKAMNFVTIREA